MRRTARRLRAAILKGHGLVCPVCGGSFRKFLGYGTPRRLNASCPGCGSMERHRLLWLYLQRECGIEHMAGRVLHFAPETGIAARMKRIEGLRYIRADLRGRGLDCRLDINCIPFINGSFDLIICSHVLEHIPDDFGAAAQMRRVLRERGKVLILAPVDPARAATFEDPAVDTPALRQQRYGDALHVRQYGADFQKRLLRIFQRVERIDYVVSLDNEDVRRYGLAEAEPVYVCD
jgi:SAM-dependent methyltransferase